jgi:4-hydroxy-3-methylbut-2-enyl diphosphate reductase
MCFGVRDAIDLAVRESRRAPLTILGELAHNEVVLRDLRGRGIEFAGPTETARTRRVMITAHGTSDRRRRELAAAGREVIEATCPLVTHAHEMLRRLVAGGFHPVVIGKAEHVEVQGLVGDYDECDVILTEEDVMKLRGRARFGVVSQTTQPLAKARALVEALRARFPDSEVRFIDTVCQPTKQRQLAAEEMAAESSVVVVVGGARSNNTRELAATCGRFCPRVHHVQTAADLRREWFREEDIVGLTAGTSTTDQSVDEVETWLAGVFKEELVS